MSDVVYLYGFVPNGTSLPPADLRGIGDAAVTLVDIGPVRAVVSHLHDPDFQPGQLEQRLDDLAWVGAQGLDHERVVAWFVDHADILPASLFSMHSSETTLRAAIASTADRLADQLQKLAGKREWNLKVAYDATVLARHGAEISEELQRLDREIVAAPAGRRYLLERKRADIAKTEVRRSARRLADDLFAALAVHAVSARVLPLTSDPATGIAGTHVVLTAALLVERAADSALQAEAAARSQPLSELGLLITFSGPWAPYRFVERDVDA